MMIQRNPIMSRMIIIYTFLAMFDIVTAGWSHRWGVNPPSKAVLEPVALHLFCPGGQCFIFSPTLYFFQESRTLTGFAAYFYFHFEIYKFLQPWALWKLCHLVKPLHHAMSPQLWGLGLGDVKPWSSWTICFSNDMEVFTEGSLNLLKVDITTPQICFFPGWFSIAQDGFLHLF